MTPVGEDGSFPVVQIVDHDLGRLEARQKDWHLTAVECGRELRYKVCCDWSAGWFSVARLYFGYLWQSS